MPSTDTEDGITSVENVWAGEDDAAATASSEVFLGIDLGTTNSAVALWNTKQSRVKVIRGRKGCRSCPSVVTFDEESGDGAPLAGHSAAEREAADPLSVTSVRCIKRVIGRQWGDVATRALLPTLPFDAVEDKEGDVGVQLASGDVRRAEVCSAALLSEVCAPLH